MDAGVVQKSSALRNKALLQSTWAHASKTREDLALSRVVRLLPGELVAELALPSVRSQTRAPVSFLRPREKARDLSSENNFQHRGRE